MPIGYCRLGSVWKAKPSIFKARTLAAVSALICRFKNTKSLLVRAKRSAMVSTGTSIISESCSSCSWLGIFSMAEGMAYSESVGALKASTAPLRSVIVPRLACCTKVRTKRLLPSVCRRFCSTVCKCMLQPAAAAKAVAKTSKTKAIRPLVLTGFFCLTGFCRICGL